ncbi:MAG: hypothetical protein GY762_14170 [Proteobacteria bacterium]|nr:hypothetical protein [Pseudomonadota bacterium]
MTQDHAIKERTESGKWLGKVLFTITSLVTIGGIAVTDFFIEKAYYYWLSATVIFCLVGVISDWSGLKKSETDMPLRLLKQVAHWIVLLPAIFVVYQLQISKQITPESAGLVTVLAVGLTATLAGIHFDKRLIVHGILLSGAAVGAAWLKTFFWWFLPVIVLGVILAVVWRKKQ